VDSPRVRRGNRAAREPIEQNLAERYGHLRNPFPPFRLYSDDQIESIHLEALCLLETIGMRVLSPGVRAYFSAAGAQVDEESQTVRLDRTLVAKALETVPREFTIHSLDVGRNVTIGRERLVIAPVGGPPYVVDLERGRRPGSMEALRDFIKLSETYDVIHLLGPCAEPQDVEMNFRHLEFTFAQLTLSDKPPWVFCRGSGQIRDCFEMIRRAHRLTDEEFRQHVYAYTVVNTNSPRQLDISMGEGIVDFSSQGQLVIVTPFTLAGAMAPVTIAGALTLAHMEALLGITLTQLVRSGAPVMYGSFTSNVDMKSGAPAFGTPEYTKACLAAGQLARRIGVPWRSSSATASNCPDAQAAYEAQMSLWGAVLGGCNLLMHGAGWLEGGLSASYEKFVLDVEMLQMFAELFQPVSATADDIGASAIIEVAPGGHFFAASHTMERYRTAFYAPLVSTRQNFGQWTEAGCKSAAERATAIWRAALARYQPPHRDPAVLESLSAYVAARRAEGGAAPLS
jgi:trimethylamine---corrinoid protein Co-methyltransferase